MRYPTFAPTFASVFAIALSLATSTASAESGLGITAGAEYTVGSYGDTIDTEIWYFPVTLKYETDLTTVKLTVPYIKITGPANVVGGAGEPIQISGTPGTQRSEAGLGDVVASASYNLYARGGTSGMLADITGKVKFGTADETVGLGTGENDYSIQLDLVKTYEIASLFGSIGMRKFGDPPGIDLRDAAFASIGTAVKFSDETSGGLIYDYRQRTIDGGSPISEVTLFVTHKLTAALKLQGYLVKGFSDGSPDRGAGVMLISAL